MRCYSLKELNPELSNQEDYHWRQTFDVTLRANTFFCVHFVSLWISFTFILILILPNVDLILTLSERRNVVTWLLIYMVVKCLNFSIFSQIFVVKLYKKDFRTYSGFIAFDRNFQTDKHELYETERKALWLWRLCGITEGNIKGILC